MGPWPTPLGWLAIDDMANPALAPRYEVVFDETLDSGLIGS